MPRPAAFTAAPYTGADALEGVHKTPGSSAGITVPETAYRPLPGDETPTAQSLEERVRQLETQNSLLLRIVGYLKDFFPEGARSLFQTAGGNKASQQKTESAPRRSGTGAMITKRELEVLRLIAEGLSAKEIADKLYITQTTVITHKKNLKEKLGVRNTAELIRKTSMLLR